MTTIIINKTKNGTYKKVICRNHAGFANAGNDIVCSAISILVINTINSIEELTDTKLEVVSDEKQAIIECSFPEQVDNGGRLLLDAMVLGLQNVVNEYGKKYLELKFEEV